MDHLNYCRSLKKQYIEKGCMINDSELDFGYQWSIALANKAQKFLLPFGGNLCDDPLYRALDETKPLRLPYPIIALEYRSDPNLPVAPGKRPATRHIVIAREVHTLTDTIAVSVVFCYDEYKVWVPMPEVCFSPTHYIDRTRLSSEGYAQMKIHLSQRAQADVPLEEYGEELHTLLSFLNALQCSNVKIAKSVRKKEKLPKGVLPFDDYHILTIDTHGKNARGEHGELGDARHAPREHLRRGHIRCYESGMKVWVNATIVNPGTGGKIAKDYRVH